MKIKSRNCKRCIYIWYNKSVPEYKFRFKGIAEPNVHPYFKYHQHGLAMVLSHIKE